MTDEIGFDAPDPPPARSARRRLLRRWSWLGWLLVALAVIAVTVVPRVRDHLAQRSARSLVAAWAGVGAYDRQRDALISVVRQRAGIADDRLVAQAIRDADREEVAALSDLRARISARHTWEGDVGRTAGLATRALTAKIAMLRGDAAAARPLLVPSGPAEVTLAQQVDAAVATLAARRHLGAVVPAMTQLAPLDRELRILRRATDSPTGLSVVIGDNGRLSAYDLDAGSHNRLPGDPGARAHLTVAAGHGVVATGEFGARFLTPGRPARSVTSLTGARALPLAGDGFWLAVNSRVRDYDALGRPTSRWYDVPAGLGSPAGATRTTIVLFRHPQVASVSATGIHHKKNVPPPVITAWTPRTGELHQLRRGCGLPVTTVDEILLVLCPADRVIAYDVDTGRLTEHPPPSGSRPEYFAPLPSPDGRYVAVEVDRLLGIDLDLLDLATDRLVRFPAFLRGAAPIAWSPDGKWLLLSTGNDGVRSRLNSYALWNALTGHIESVRMPPGTPAFSVGVALLSRGRPS